MIYIYIRISSKRKIMGDNNRMVQERIHMTQHNVPKWRFFDAYFAKSSALLCVAAVFAVGAAIYNLSKIGIKGTDSHRCQKCLIKPPA